MSITNILRKSLLLPVALFVFIAGALFASITLNTHAQSISLEPISMDRSNPAERGWFLYNVKPGDTIKDTVAVRNATQFDTKVKLNPNDATVTTDGTFSLASNEVKNTQLGSWISLSQDTVEIKGGESLGVPFTITIPQDAKSGEYAGGLSAVIINDEETSGIGAKLRLGVRMYLTVDGDLSMNPEISSMKIVSPKDADFEDRLRSRGSTTPDSMGFFLTAAERGNIYSKSVNKATFTLPDGKSETKTFTRNYIPGQSANEFYLETKLPYQVGETKVTLEYEASPFIDNKPNLKKSNTTGTLNFSMNLTQEDINKFNEVYNSIKKEKDTRREKATQSKPLKDTSFTVQEGNLTEVAPAKSSESGINPNIVYGLGGLVALLLVALIAVVLKKKKSDSKTEVKTEKVETTESTPVAADVKEVKKNKKK